MRKKFETLICNILLHVLERITFVIRNHVSSSETKLKKFDTFRVDYKIIRRTYDLNLLSSLLSACHPGTRCDFVSSSCLFYINVF